MSSSPEPGPDEHFAPELNVRNTFLHFDQPKEPERRTRSASPRLGGGAEQQPSSEDQRVVQSEVEGSTGSGDAGPEFRRRRHLSKKERARRRRRASSAAPPVPGHENISEASDIDGEWILPPIVTPPSELDQSVCQSPLLLGQDDRSEPVVGASAPDEPLPHLEVDPLDSVEAAASTTTVVAAAPAATASLNAGFPLNGARVASLIPRADGMLIPGIFAGAGLLTAAAVWKWLAPKWRSQCERFGTAIVPRGPDYRILLLGQTGSGKTKFLDLLCNWAKLRHLKQQNDGLSMVDRLESFHDERFESAKEQKMSSKTDRASRYPVCLDGENVIWEIVDTSGFADTRGMEYDRDNVSDIVTCLKEVEFVNCIVLVINGRDARMTTSLRYVLTQICSIMPRAVLQHVFVVFTNTSDDLQLNFDISQLKPYIDEGIDQRYIVLENPLASIEKASGSNGRIPKARLTNALEGTLDRSFEAMADFFQNIKDLEAVHTVDFMQLYDARQRVERGTMDLLAEYDHNSNVIATVERFEAEIEAAARLKFLNKDFRTTKEMKKRSTKSTNRHNTLCGHPKCYSNCHAPCNLPKSMDKDVFKKCSAMRSDLACSVCGHSFKYHYHDEVKWVEQVVVESLVDEEMKRKFDSAQGEEQQRQSLLEGAQMKLKELDERKQSLAWELASNISDFETHAALRPYNQLLVQQIAMINQAIEAFADDDGSTNQERNRYLRETRDGLEKRLIIINEALSISNNRQPRIVQTATASRL